MNNIKNKLIEQIKAGEVAMKPRWHFVLRAMFMAVSTALVVLMAVYLLSLVFYFLVQSGLVYAPQFGGLGLALFLGSFPWLLVVLLLAFLGSLFLLVKQYSFSYHQPLIYSIIGVSVFVLLASFAIHQTTMHERLHPLMERYPGVGAAYKAARVGEIGGVIAGEVQRSTESGFVMKTISGEEVDVMVTPETKHRRGEVWQAGARVLVFGERSADGQEITAFGIRPDDGRRPAIRGGEQSGQVIRAKRLNQALPY
jgi:hypothetical protein